MAIAFDAGMTYAVGESGMRLGVSLKNIGSDLAHGGTGMVRHVRSPSQRLDASNNALQLEGESVELPSMLNFGVSYTRDVGAEISQDMDLTFYSGANFGAGLNLDVAGTQISIDYAYRGTQFFNAVQMLTASVAL